MHAVPLLVAVLALSSAATALAQPHGCPRVSNSPCVLAAEALPRLAEPQLGAAPLSFATPRYVLRRTFREARVLTWASQLRWMPEGAFLRLHPVSLPGPLHSVRDEGGVLRAEVQQGELGSARGEPFYLASLSLGARF